MVLPVSKTGVHKFRATKFSTVVPNMCGCLVCNLIRIALLSPWGLEVAP
jgi:hypothetical protein